MTTRDYPVSCPSCKKKLYGPTVFCPFCGKRQEKDSPSGPKIDNHKEEKSDIPPAGTKGLEANDNKSGQSLGSSINSESEDKLQEPKKQPPRQEPVLSPAKANNPAHSLNLNLIILILGIIAIIGATGFIFLQVKKAEQETIVIEAKSETAAAEAKAEKEWLKIEAQKRKDDENERLDSLRKAEEEKQLIYNYLSEGKSHYNKGEYKLAIMSMKEVIRRDNTNREAERFIQLATKELDRIKKEFEYPEIGTPR